MSGHIPGRRPLLPRAPAYNAPAYRALFLFRPLLPLVCWFPFQPTRPAQLSLFSHVSSKRQVRTQRRVLHFIRFTDEDPLVRGESLEPSFFASGFRKERRGRRIGRTGELGD